jgi:hypothetical protein
MEASNMLDVLHYFFEEDLFYSTVEQAEGRDRSRVAIYQDFYNSSYAYSTTTGSTASGKGYTKNFDDYEFISEEEEEKIVPFDPLQINTIQDVRYKTVNENGEMSGVVLE